MWRQRPAREQGFDADIGVLFQPFQWDENAPRLWLFTTLGLSALAQPKQRRFPLHIERFEVCAALREPICAQWGEFRRAWKQNSLGALDAVPSLLHTFALIGQDFASWILRDGESFGFGDSVLNAAWLHGFPSAVLCPPVPELFTTGLTPFSIARDGSARKGDIGISHWAQQNALLSAGDHLFVQLAPVRSEEFDAALKLGGLDFFLNGLLSSDQELEAGFDSSAFIADPNRVSRLDVFLEARRARGAD
jgi:Suppressor of fused protein (SUFU)